MDDQRKQLNGELESGKNVLLNEMVEDSQDGKVQDEEHLDLELGRESGRHRGRDTVCLRGLARQNSSKRH